MGFDKDLWNINAHIKKSNCFEHCDIQPAHISDQHINKYHTQMDILQNQNDCLVFQLVLNY